MEHRKATKTHRNTEFSHKQRAETRLENGDGDLRMKLVVSALETRANYKDISSANRAILTRVEPSPGAPKGID